MRWFLFVWWCHYFKKGENIPAKNIKKNYVPNAYYHVFNRGILRKKVFLEDADYLRMRKILREVIKNSEKRIRISVWNLLPNHFHLQLRQKNVNDMTLFMKSVLTRYGMYFNAKYNGSGRVFQNIYKASWLRTPYQRRMNRKYILENAQKAGFANWKHVGTEKDL